MECAYANHTQASRVLGISNGERTGKYFEFKYLAVRKADPVPALTLSGAQPEAGTGSAFLTCQLLVLEVFSELALRLGSISPGRRGHRSSQADVSINSVSGDRTST
jgi:hypothetical protein